jgi:hypothetical protein
MHKDTNRVLMEILGVCLVWWFNVGFRVPAIDFGRARGNISL